MKVPLSQIPNGSDIAVSASNDSTIVLLFTTGDVGLFRSMRRHIAFYAAGFGGCVAFGVWALIAEEGVEGHFRSLLWMIWLPAMAGTFAWCSLAFIRALCRYRPDRIELRPTVLRFTAGSTSSQPFEGLAGDGGLQVHPLGLFRRPRQIEVPNSGFEDVQVAHEQEFKYLDFGPGLPRIGLGAFLTDKECEWLRGIIQEWQGQCRR